MQPNSQRKRNRPKVPPSKRQRVVQACTACRVRKRKCLPIPDDACQQCKRSGLECVFMPVEADPTEIKNETKEPFQAALGRFQEAYPDVDLELHHVAFLSRILDEFHTKNEATTTTTAVAAAAAALTAPEEMAGPSMLQPSPPDASKPAVDLGIGAFAGAAGSTAAAPQRRFQYMYNPQHIYGDSSITLSTKIRDLLPSRAEADILVDLFFAYAETNYCYIDETLFRARMDRCYDDSLKFVSTDFTFAGLVLAVFALASQFLHIRQGYPARSLATSGSGQELSPNPPGMQYFRGFQLLLPWMLAKVTLESVQGCLLTGLYVLPTHNTNMAYTYLGLSLRLAICLVYSRKDNAKDEPVSMQTEIEHRVFWAAYTIERSLTVYLSFPQGARQEDIQCPLPQRRPDLDPPDSLRVDRLVTCIDLIVTFDRILHLKNEGLTTGAEFEDACSSLVAWYNGLPPALRTLEGSSLRANVHLQLHYHMAWVYLGRGELHKTVKKHLASSKGSVPDAHPPEDLSDSKLAVFSATDFHACSCATITILLDSILHPTSKAFPKVTLGMEVLRFMAVQNANAMHGLRYVEVFLNIVNSALMAIFKQQTGQAEEWPLDSLGLDADLLSQLPASVPVPLCQDVDGRMSVGFLPAEVGLAFNSLGIAEGDVEPRPHFSSF